MKTIHWILISITILLLAAGSYLYFKKKKQSGQDAEEPDVSDDVPYTPKKETKKTFPKGTAGNKLLQETLNKILPSLGQPKIKVDGIIGDETKSAYEIVKKAKDSLPSNSIVDSIFKQFKL